MNIYSLARSQGILGLQNNINAFFNSFKNSYKPRPLMNRAFFSALKQQSAMDENQEKILTAALDEIERNEKLLLLSHFFVSDFCALPTRLSHDEYDAMTPSAGMNNAETYAFLLLLACMEPSMERLRLLGMPPRFYEDTVFAAARRQFEKWRAGGDASVADFPWDINFYTGGIFKIGRFLFKFEKFWQPVVAYRKGNETAAFFYEPQSVRRDGQLNGVNGWKDPEAYPAVFQKNADMITGHRIHPAGVVERRPVSLPAREWKKALREGDTTLGMHIPGGPGYNPACLKESLEKARAFFIRWFPDIKPRAFANESWLNDLHIPRIMDGRGNIPQMQKEMYLLPTPEGDDMMWHELFPEGRDSAPRTRLQKAAANFMGGGGRFTTAAMFILWEDIARIGSGPYARAEEYEDVWLKL